jgi:hypothetical protein
MWQISETIIKDEISQALHGKVFLILTKDNNNMYGGSLFVKTLREKLYMKEAGPCLRHGGIQGDQSGHHQLWGHPVQE